MEKEIKVLNLYACLGGNRFKWNSIKGLNVSVTAVELDEDLANCYKERFPNDKVIMGDAHQYLLENFKDFDFIWSSPPCPTHSRVRISQKNRSSFNFKYADMRLYQEVIFLDNFFNGFYCVENVIPYYKPLIPAQKIDRHLYWCNFNTKGIRGRKKPKNMIEEGKIEDFAKFHKYDFGKYKGSQKKQKIARNLVDYDIGLKLLKRAFSIKDSREINQRTLF